MRLLFIPLILISLIFSWAQHPVHVTSFNRDNDGFELSSHCGTDKQRYSWFTPESFSSDWVIRFDPYAAKKKNSFRRIRNIGSRSGNWKLIPRGMIYGTNLEIVDNDGFLWYATDNGLHQLKNGGVFLSLKKRNGLLTDTIISITKSNQGIYILSSFGINYYHFSNNKLYTVSDNKFKIIRSSSPKINGEYSFSEYVISNIYFNVDSSDVLWFGWKEKNDTIEDFVLHSYLFDEGQFNHVKFEIPLNPFSHSIYTHNEGISISGKSTIEGIKKRIYLSHKSSPIEYQDDIVFISEFNNGLKLFKKGKTLLGYFDDLLSIVQGEAEVDKVYEGLWSIVHPRFGIKFHDELWIRDYKLKSTIIIDTGTVRPIGEVYPELDKAKDYTISKISNNSIWSRDYFVREPKIERVEFMRSEIINNSRRSKIHGNVFLGYNQEADRAYFYNAYPGYMKDIKEGIYVQNSYRDTLIPLNIDIDFSVFKLKSRLSNETNFYGPTQDGSFWLIPYNILTNSYSCFFYDAINQSLVELFDLSARVSKSELFSISTSDNTFCLYREDTVKIWNNEKIINQYALNFKAIEIKSLSAEKQLIKSQDSIYFYNKGICLNVNAEFDISQELSDDFYFYSISDKTIVLNFSDSIFLFLTEQGLEKPDVLKYPILKQTKTIFCDNLGRYYFVLDLESNPIDSIGVYWNGDYKFYSIPEYLSFYPPSYNLEDSSIIIITFDGPIYKLDENSGTFYKVGNNSNLGYVWDPVYMNGVIRLSGYSEDLFSIDLRNSKYKPSVVDFRSLRINGSSIDLESQLDIDHDDVLSIELYLLENSVPRNYEYQYRIEKNTNWSFALTDNTIHLDNLPKGKNQIQFRAKGKQKVWGPPIELVVYVQPPWYQSNIAYSGYGLTLLLLIFAGNRWNTYRLRRYNEVLQKKGQKQDQNYRGEEYSNYGFY